MTIQPFPFSTTVKKGFPLILIAFFTATTLFAQFNISGKVVSKTDKKPIPGATVSIPVNGLWATTNAKGEFNIKSIRAGQIKIQVQYLGFVKKTYDFNLNKNIDNFTFQLDEDNLALNEVEITAKKGDQNLATSFVIDRSALDHLQMLDATDVTALLPGGKTISPTHLATTAAQRFQINGNTGERGNPTFGVGVEVDGIRLSNNGSRDGAGIDTKNIATSNIESVEIVTGIPSVEHGDMTNGFVKIETRKGASPYILEMSTRPNTKQVALSKGLRLGENSGVLNFNVDYLKSIANLSSPYTAYDRNSLSLNYTNTFNKRNKQPLALNIGIAGNIGGYNSSSDPDIFVNTYSKSKDNTFRGNISAKWLLNKPWLTNIEAAGSINFNDKIAEVSANKSATSSIASIRTKDEGYHVGEKFEDNPNAALVLIPRGNWYEVNYNDSKLVNYNARIKGNLFKKIGKAQNNIMLGADYSGSGNQGRGNYYQDLRYAPTWREYRYDEEPYVNNLALFAENTLTIPIQKSSLQLVAGLRSELTSIQGSEYGNINNLSPRFNAKYVFWRNQRSQTISDLDVKIGWGKTVKTPGFDALYPVPRWRDILTFSPGTTSTGETYYAYYTMNGTRQFNPNLQWQSNTQKELALNATIAGNRLFVSVSHDRTANPYLTVNNYEPFYYKYTSQANLEATTIAAENRIYTVDKQTGIVTVTDRTNAKPAEQLGYTDMYGFSSIGSYTNGSDVKRTRINWKLDFKQIKALRTTITIDGNYYRYKNIEETVSAYMPNATQNMANGKPYAYIGFFTGGDNTNNGNVSKSVDMNFTLTTHIPKLRLILSGRVEGSLYNYSQRLSEAGGKQRGFVLHSREGYEPSATETNIYKGNQYVGVYPDYYVSLDDLNTKIPFAEKFIWAKTNDVALYNELAKMVMKTNYNYLFNSNHLSPYLGANLRVTKEIGKYASLSFFANNFNINMGKVHSSMADTETSLFNSSSIPVFNYGASLRIKL